MTTGTAILTATVLVLTCCSPYFRQAVTGIVVGFLALIAVGLVVLFGYLLITNASDEDIHTLVIGTIIFFGIKWISLWAIKQREKAKLRRRWLGRD